MYNWGSIAVMEINRRRFLQGLALTPLITQASLANAALPERADKPVNRYASASMDDSGQYFLHVVDDRGDELLRHSIPERAHQVISHPTKPWVFGIARRPGTFIEVVDYDTLSPIARIETEAGYHLYGHAQITADGRYLLTTENRMSDHQGMVVVRDTERDFAVVKRFSTHGIGPHQAVLTLDQSTLVVANGGIQTEGREKVNLDRMVPSLVYLDAQSGELLEQAFLPEQYHQCSIRHIDVSRTGEVIIAMQYQGHPADQVPLVASHKRGEALNLMQLDPLQSTPLKQYCGSACFDQSGHYAAVSAPRGGRIMIWDMRDHSLIGFIKAKDGCGLACTNSPGEFVASTGRGRLYHIDVAGLVREKILYGESLVHWDNHMFPVQMS
jgi:hypothetical protein